MIYRNKKIAILFACITIINNTQATEVIHTDSKKIVNVIAFYGFLEDQRIKNAVESQCNVNFSHDSYYTNAEFLHTFYKQRNYYDVMIFSNMVYGSIKNQLPNIENSNLWKSSNDYYPYFKNYYRTKNYTKNTAFFTHSIVGFMYNPELINITPDQKMSDIFKSAKENNVILVDDSGEIGNLLTIGFSNDQAIQKNSDGTVSLTYENLKRMTQNSKVYITSDFNRIYDSKNFALSYIWSGDALLYIKKSGKPYKFVIPSNASSICTDLIVQMKDTPEANCVANVLQNQSTLEYFENNTYFFSPYFKNHINDKSYRELYEKTKKTLPKLRMIQPVENFEKEYNDNWNKIKLNISKNNFD
ncbi:spermidine/putrescine-binding periplasmic protein precursor potD (SPBP) [Legionella nautarum]|uniref:Spermidine/putrescine-binding periplasmic protein potD (SPBP) n=1 Tax=Legionella nautarum TaxID=45070 RepID=A0A0W0WIN5_9GAMM|nr:hypothetical protein [Legionella nautarum]KTD32184.1 spermidine/putrescine-binding periplasmic protein precursor potD (SPBP) [Legionella nautarum]